MRYTKQSIELVQNANIVTTISNFVKLDKKGAGYQCCSPFTDERSPSFKVSPAKDIFKCFSSGLGGDGIHFVMEHKNVDFIEAIEIIAKIHNINLEKEEVTPEVQRQLDQKGEMYNFNTKCSRSFFNNYKKLDPAHWAKQLINGREFNEESIIKFQIGYADDTHKLKDWAINNGTLSVAKELGLVKTSSNATYDTFINRIMFPIHNHKGAVVGFGGRRSDAEEVSKYAKYVNSSTSLIYNKSAVLYGLYQAKSAISAMGSVILTEGYTDVIAMHQHNCENTVGSGGTALTDMHAQLLKKYADEAILLRDGDRAGLDASLRKDGDIDKCLEHGLDVNICILPEGEDPDTFSRAQLDISTWIENNKQDAILYKIGTLNVERDRYEQDVTDVKTSVKLQVKTLEETLLELEGLDKAELTKAKAFNKETLDEIKRIKAEGKTELNDIQRIDPTKKALAVTEAARVLFKIKHEIKREAYVKQVAKVLKVTAPALKAEIGKFEIEAEEQAKKEAENTAATKFEYNNLKFPEGADEEEYLKYGFITIGNQYLFVQGGHFFEASDFRFNPLFQIMGEKENKRLAEITNTANQKQVIVFDSEMLASFNELRRFLLRQNGFLFYDSISKAHYDMFVRRYNRDFEPAEELLTMGWNDKGFYAFSNGINWQGKFRHVNKYGIINLKGIDTTESEYRRKIDNFYSPAFSVMYKDAQKGDDEFENDRYFVYKESAITIEEWMEQMLLVFEEKGLVGILFNFGALFRDLFLKHYDYFPLLGGFGEKDSGKSGFGKILQNFYYYRLPAIDLTQATLVGVSRTLTRNVNTVIFADEFKDKTIKEDIGNLLMGSWNGNGRVKGKGVGTNKSSIDKINSAVYYAGQYMPTFNENALATRTMSLFFHSKNFSTQAKHNYNRLLNCTNAGISSLVVDIVQHREYFEKRLPSVHSETERELKQLLKGEDYQERIFGNVAMLYTTYSILRDKITFPFSEDEVRSICIEIILTNSEQIADSNALSDFWSILTFLFENNRIQDHREFVIDRKATISFLGKRDKKEKYQNTDLDQILYLRLPSVHQYYVKEASTRTGVDPIGMTTIREYFKSTPEFIGLIKGKRFGVAGSHSCYAFNYTKLRAKTSLNLVKDTTIYEKEAGDTAKDEHEITAKDPVAVTANGEDDEDLPF